MNRYRTCRNLDGDAAPHEIAGTLAPDLDRRMRRRCLLDLSRELGEHSANRRFTRKYEIRHALHHFARVIAAVCCNPKADFGAIRLIGEFQVLDEACRLPDGNRKHAGRRRVECPCMADALPIEYLSDDVDGVVGRHAGGF